MTQALIAHHAKVYFTPQSQGWERLQKVYARPHGESDRKARARRGMYRNALLSALGQIQFLPRERTNLFTALLNHVEVSHSFDGLETPFLTLLHCAFLDGERELYDRALSSWNQFSANPQAFGSGPVRFYDVKKRTATFFMSDAVASMRAGGPNEGVLRWNAGLAESISRLGLFTLEDTFNPNGPQNPTLHFLSGELPPGTSVQRAQKTADKDAAWWHVVGTVLIIGGVIAEAIPGGQAVGTIMVVGGLVVEAVPDVIKVVGDQTNGASSINVPIGDTEVGESVFIEDGGGNIGEAGGLEGEDGGDGGDGRGGGCFRGDTLVLMADGSRREIGQIAVNDLVLARPEQGGSVGPRRVTRLYTHHVEQTVRLELLGQGAITTTQAHRFCVQGQGFVPASCLEKGMRVESGIEAGGFAVERLQHQYGPTTVYNLSVDKDPTYFVGSQALLVHNLKDQTGPEEPA